MKQMAFPRIRPSLQIITRENGLIYVGTVREGLELDADPYLSILRSCNGRTTISEIAAHTYRTPADIQILLTQLAELGIIEFLSSAPIVNQQGTETLITGDLIARERVENETTLISLRHNDGGESEWQSRATLSLIITGDTRVARNLLALLSASGFPQVTLLLEGNASQHIEVRDINGLSVTIDDLGKNKGLHHRDLMRRSKVGYLHNTYQFGNHSHPDLIIATTMPRADEIQRWQSEGIPHIALGDPVGSEIEIFPIITPGFGPCLQCIALHKADALPRDLRALNYPLHMAKRSRELPVGAAALIAALLTSRVIDWAWRCAASASSDGEERKISRVINLLDPMRQFLERSWNHHPECGCVDVRRRAWPR